MKIKEFTPAKIIKSTIALLTGVSSPDLETIERVLCTLPSVAENNNEGEVYLVQYYEKLVSTGRSFHAQSRGPLQQYIANWISKYKQR